MKRSELKNYIRENIISELSENTEDEIAKTKELTTAIKDLESAKKEAGIEENANMGLADIEEMGYRAADDVFTIISKSYINSQIDFRYFQKGLIRGLSDIAGSMGLNENQAKTVDDVIDPADYGDIGKGYLDGFNKPNSLDADQLETLGRKIVKQLYKGDFDKAKAKFIKENVNMGLADLGEMGYENGEKAFDMHFDKSILNNTPDTKAYTKGFVQAIIDSAGSLRLNENEDAEPTKSDIKKTKGLAKAKEELALLTREMKSLAKKYSKAKGEEKEKLVKILKDKTKLKKELENILDKKKI